MSRTSPDAVANLLRDYTQIPGGNYDGVTDLQQHCDVASALVDWLQNKDHNARHDPDQLSDTMLELIERNLAAHNYLQADPMFQSKSTGGASGSFQGQTGTGLDGTKFGQQALRLDVTNWLARRELEAKTGMKRVASALWLGENRCSR